ncbi:MAG: NTP transferase domain-containing protein [bacterium]|nr:NTP transferase domain-containing protein [bacterium]
MGELIGLIPAAGRGVRAYPYTDTIPKSMLEVDGVPLVQRNVELLRDQLGVRELRIVVGHHGHVIREHLGDGARFGVRITYLQNDRLDLELSYSIFLGTRGLDAPCVVVLADECYVGSNHRRLLDVPWRDAFVTCGVRQAESAGQVRKNYAVTVERGFITAVEEKPRVAQGRLMGTGTWLLTPAVYPQLAAEFADLPSRRPFDWVAWLGAQGRTGARLLPFHLSGGYVNVNSRDDLHHANYLAREERAERHRASLVLVVDQWEARVADAVAGFLERPEIAELVVVSRGRLPDEERLAGLERVHRLVVGDLPVGRLVTAGLDAASGSILLLSYHDETFAPRDVAKLLVYLREADMVVGTRTTRQMLEQGSNMRGSVRAAHLLLAKLTGVLWWQFEARFTDVCSMYRGLWASTYRAIRPNLVAEGIEVFPELGVEVLRARRRIVEVPVNYRNPDIDSPFVHSRYQRVATFQRVLALLVRRRIEPGGTRRPTPPTTGPAA